MLFALVYHSRRRVVRPPARRARLESASLTVLQHESLPLLVGEAFEWAWTIGFVLLISYFSGLDSLTGALLFVDILLAAQFVKRAQMLVMYLYL